jgi:DNA modification methylase
VKDRPTRAHEYIFLLSKSERYYYDREAILEPGRSNGNLRNRRTVWSIKTRPSRGSHFSTFPPELIHPCVLAATEAGDSVLDPFFGSGTVGQVCLELGRKFLGIELKPEYAELAMRRLGWAPVH